MPLVKTQQTRTPGAWCFDSFYALTFPAQTLSDGVANTTISGTVLVPVASKIAKVMVYAAAIDTLAGTDLINVVVGANSSGAYTAGVIAPNDNSLIGPPPGGLGYPTVFAVAGDALFAADQALTATNGQVQANLQPAFPVPTTTTDSVWAFRPTHYDAVYPAGTPLTLRVTTTASTGAITSLVVCLLLSPAGVEQRLEGNADYYIPLVDF